MIQDSHDWKRNFYENGGYHALIYYVIYGKFDTSNVNVSQAKYRTEGLPEGFSFRKLDRNRRAVLPFTDGDFARHLRSSELLEQIQHAPECLVLHGEIPDPPDLNYLRNSIGLVTYFLDNGGVALCDPQQLAFYDRGQWHNEFFEDGKPHVSKHATILCSGGPDGRWYHTRGLRKFARPDISIRSVPPEYCEPVIELCRRFIEMQALGAQIEEGREIQMASLPSGLICHHRGSLEDPEFNNVHIEICWPEMK